LIAGAEIGHRRPSQPADQLHRGERIVDAPGVHRADVGAEHIAPLLKEGAALRKRERERRVDVDLTRIRFDLAETLVGERGVSLSGGQRQRLSIARSVLLSPPILVFDDSTAAIDAATEQGIREALRTATATRATIIIAHRLGSLMDADEIVFLERGRIVERGTHAELLELGGRYANLYALQSLGGEPPEEGAGEREAAR
jgi:ABC-type multidrug transport system ATPase subunit